MWLPASVGLVTLVVLACALGAGAPAHGTSSGQVATVERIIDGDTLVVRGGQRVRLVQIDSPEAGGECYSAAATRELARLARPGLRVVLELDPRLDRVDRYGRLLRYVHAGRTNVNVELVRRGAATPWFYDGDRGRYAARLLAAVSAARRSARGMWGACRVSWGPGERRRDLLPLANGEVPVPRPRDVLQANQTFGPCRLYLKRGPRHAQRGNLWPDSAIDEGGPVTAAQFETIDETEAEMILRWRFDELARSGYDVDSALLLASHVEVDLHDASALLRRGCPPETALRILL